ncbi:MAG TPA: response regulator [Alloacidobacterium sp.]|nr:response regulator [Alloacidobacterium sp.]
MTTRKYVILCVDDEPTSLLVRSRVLEKAGYYVVPANSAEAALGILTLQSVDLVLTDLLMPGINGAELAREIKIRNPKLPVILFSGVNEEPADKSNIDLFLSKLEGPVSLCEKVAEILRNTVARP